MRFPMTFVSVFCSREPDLAYVALEGGVTVSWAGVSSLRFLGAFAGARHAHALLYLVSMHTPTTLTLALHLLI